MKDESSLKYDGVFAKAIISEIRVNTLIDNRSSKDSYQECSDDINAHMDERISKLNHKYVLLLVNEECDSTLELPNESMMASVSTAEQVANIIIDKFLSFVYIKNIDKLEYDKIKYVSVEESIYELVQEEILFGERCQFFFTKVVKETI